MPNQKLLQDLTDLGLERDPVVSFQKWYQLAKENIQVEDPSQMMLATVGPDAQDNSAEDKMQPSMRWVQMNHFGDDGLVFSTNTNSRKGIEIAGNNRVGIYFSWFPISKLIYIEGTVSELSLEDTKRYFESMPRDTQIGFAALNNKQSQPLDSPDKINEKANQLRQSNSDRYDMPRTFSAYKVNIHRFEFIHLQKEKLDDRIAFTRKGFTNMWLNQEARQEDKCLQVPVNLGDHGEWFIERFGV